MKCVAPSSQITLLQIYHSLLIYNLKSLRKEVKDNAGHDQGMFGWLVIRFGVWGMSLAKIGALLLIVLTLIGLIFCCCIPIVRSVIASRLSKEMTLMVTRRERDEHCTHGLQGLMTANRRSDYDNVQNHPYVSSTPIHEGHLSY